MSFSASAKRARDESQPLGRRVACLHECLERFNLFGYTATRHRLRHMVGASQDGWTERQILAALELLEPAKRSWSAYLEQENERRRAQKREDHNSPPRPLRATFTAWLDEYLQGDTARTWLVEQLGDCGDCGHRLIHHGGYACGACGSDPRTAWDERCREPMPPPT